MTTILSEAVPMNFLEVVTLMLQLDILFFSNKNKVVDTLFHHEFYHKFIRHKILSVHLAVIFVQV